MHTIPRVRGGKWFTTATHLTDECRQETERLVRELVAMRRRWPSSIGPVSIEPAPYIGPSSADMQVNVCQGGFIYATVWRDGFSR